MVLASLAIPNYRRFFWGQLVSVSGTWVQSTAQAWLVLHDLHEGASSLGLLSGVTFLPIATFGLWAGVVADRIDRRRMVLCTQTWMALVAAVQAVIVLCGVARFWMVLCLAFALGFGNAFDIPARQAFLEQLVGREQLPNAVALNSAIFNGGRVVGPAVGGLLVAAVGTGWCFAINSASFFAVICGLSLVRTQELHPSQRAPRAKGQVREGMRYATRTPVLLSTLVLLAVVGTFTFNFQIVLPLLAKETFGGDARLVGLFSAVLGAGCLCTSLAVASRRGPTQRFLVGACTALGVAELLLAAAPSLLLAFAALALVGGAFISTTLTINATLQLASEPHMRGRVMAMYAFLFAGTTPVGGPLIGWISQHGARWGAAVGGVAALVGAGLVPIIARAAAGAATAAGAAATDVSGRARRRGSAPVDRSEWAD